MRTKHGSRLPRASVALQTALEGSAGQRVAYVQPGCGPLLGRLEQVQYPPILGIEPITDDWIVDATHEQVIFSTDCIQRIAYERGRLTLYRQ